MTITQNTLSQCIQAPKKRQKYIAEVILVEKEYVAVAP